jgi:signal transduction histidine kinase
MSAPNGRRLAVTAFGLTVAALVVQTIFLIVDRAHLNPQNGDPFFYALLAVSTAAIAVVGALIVARNPGNAVGLSFVWLALSFTVTIALSLYAAHALVYAPGSLPAATLAAWVQSWLSVSGAPAIVLVFLLFPNGRPPSSRWRPVLWATAVSAVVLTITWMIKPGVIGQSLGSVGPLGVGNPVGVGEPNGVVDVVLVVATIALLVTAALGIVSVVFRYRSVTGEERQQVRWLALVGAMLGVLFVISFVVSVVICGGSDHGACGAIGTLLFVAFFSVLALGLPIACGVAILKYRLYDLDVVVKKTVVFAVVAAFITALYVVIVVAVPTLTVGAGSGSGFSPLALATTVIVAILFQPVRNRARRLADRIVYGRRATPYEVLSEFSERLSEAYSTDDVLPRMVELVRQSAGASSVRVGVLIGNEIVPSATSPNGHRAEGPLLPPTEEAAPLEQPLQSFPVRHQGELLGAIEVELPANDPMTPAKRKLVQDLASQAGLVLRNVRLIEELRASRRRIVTAQDARAKKLERNIHDGAQQRLVALTVKLRLAEQLAKRDPDKAAEMLADLQRETTETLEELRDLARGIYPPLLADKGLVEALRAQARKAAVPVVVEADGVGRYPQEVEAAVYFSCLEALQNVAKYAEANGARIRLRAGEGELVFEVDDDGRGFDAANAPRGSGLQGMADRLEALGGRIEIESAPGKGTTVIGRCRRRRARRPRARKAPLLAPLVAWRPPRPPRAGPVRRPPSGCRRPRRTRQRGARTPTPRRLRATG